MHGLVFAYLWIQHSCPKNYLKNRKQRAKINSTYSYWKGILFGGTTKIFLCGLFYMISDTDLTSYADDNITKT